MAKRKAKEETYLSTSEASEFLGCNTETIRRMRKRGEVEGFRRTGMNSGRDRSYYFRKADLVKVKRTLQNRFEPICSISPRVNKTDAEKRLERHHEGN